MHPKPILIVPGSTKSIFFEIFFKVLKSKKFVSPLIVICSADIFRYNLKKYKLNCNFEIIKSDTKKLKLYKKIYILDVELIKNKREFHQKKNEKIYVLRTFEEAFRLLEKKITYKFLNGPINKTDFLNKEYLGITEYISSRFNKKNVGMLIYNKKLSVSPLTTHLPIKLVPKNVTKKKISIRLKVIEDFYLKNFDYKPKIAVAGLNPHCESILKFNEDHKIIYPIIKKAKQQKILVDGPYSADTIFLKQNRQKFDVILGMYHDQVLAPFKTLYEYDAINITMGLPFLRVSPDHGPNEKMINKNLSNPTSLYKALEFLDKN